MPKAIAFVRGFRVPKQQDIDAALGADASFTDVYKSSFEPLPQPRSELDWLANYKETGQTYAKFLDECPFLDDGNPRQKHIYLTLLDDDDRFSSLDIKHLTDYTQRFFQMEVKLLPLFSNIHWNDAKRTWICNTPDRHGSTKDTTLRTRYDRASDHSQICVNNVLNLLKRAVPADARCLVAITLHDFYSDASDLFIAGLAQGNARVAAFSFFRYDPRLKFGSEFWHDWKIKQSNSASMSQIILLRSCRLLTHEIGHLLVDLRKLAQLAGFDIVQRYEQLLEFCTDKGFEDEKHVLQRRLAILKNDQPSHESNPLTNERLPKAKRLKKN